MDGIINVYKESGYTSHDVVAKLRGILHTKKIGHTGTLDPMAEGVLPVCVGHATKLCEQLSDHDKEYEAVMILGKTYDTLDVTGTLLEEKEVMSTKEDIEAAASAFVGGYDQIPPMYSAKKVDGKKLYDLARSGVVIERKPVFVNIYDIKVESVSLPEAVLTVSCGKGTYIRSLIDDIGKKLGCGAAMKKLTRTKVGEFTVDKAYRLSDIEKAMAEDRISDVIVDLEDIFADLERADMTAQTDPLLRNGNIIPGKIMRSLLAEISRKDGLKIRMYDSRGEFLGVYEYNISRDIYKPYKMFLS